MCANMLVCASVWSDLKADAQFWEINSLEPGVFAGVNPQPILQHAGLAAHLHPSSLILVVLWVLHIGTAVMLYRLWHDGNEVAQTMA